MKFKITTVWEETLERMIKDVPKLQNYIDTHRNLCDVIDKTDYCNNLYQELLINFSNLDELIEFRNTFDKDIIICRKEDDDEYNTIEIYHTWRE